MNLQGSWSRPPRLTRALPHDLRFYPLSRGFSDADLPGRSSTAPIFMTRLHCTSGQYRSQTVLKNLIGRLIFNLMTFCILRLWPIVDDDEEGVAADVAGTFSLATLWGNHTNHRCRLVRSS